MENLAVVVGALKMYFSMAAETKSNLFLVNLKKL